MPFRINHYPSKQKPDLFRPVYPPLTYYEPRKYIDASRYHNTRLLRTKHPIHPNKFIQQTFDSSRARAYHETVYPRWIKTTSEDSYYIVESPAVNRLDIIALQFYGSSSLWWILAKANPAYMFDPFNIPLGASIRVPAMSTVYGTGGVL